MRAVSNGSSLRIRDTLKAVIHPFRARLASAATRMTKMPIPSNTLIFELIVDLLAEQTRPIQIPSFFSPKARQGVAEKI